MQRAALPREAAMAHHDPLVFLPECTPHCCKEHRAVVDLHTYLWEQVLAVKDQEGDKETVVDAT